MVSGRTQRRVGGGACRRSEVCRSEALVPPRYPLVSDEKSKVVHLHLRLLQDVLRCYDWRAAMEGMVGGQLAKAYRTADGRWKGSRHGRPRMRGRREPLV